MIIPDENTSSCTGELVAEDTVTVQVALSISPNDVWQLLTRPDLVAQWFGTLNAPLLSGESRFLDFGDGDFFRLDAIRLEPPHQVAYRWRFLDLGPQNIITWTITPQDIGCLITVTDQEGGRSPETAHMLKEGWLDFTQRLVHFAMTGENARYDWRKEIDGSIELPGESESAYEAILQPKTLTRWFALPTASIQIAELCSEAPNRLSFHLKDAEWLHDTMCELTLLSRGERTILSFSHVGWEGIGGDGAYQLQQRRQFCEFWIKALQKARDLAEQG
ncbi:MAG TPA: SRPBCC family protein [Ktedonosporobacter sp.]|nr:SRPBCC family protein [Ktedonosporobacter sp.]